MPFYDVTYASTSNATPGTETSQLWVVTAANQETLSIMGYYAAARFASAGGCQMRMKSNTGTIASGGTGFTPTKKNIRSAPAAQSTWATGATAITPGTTLVVRGSVGFAATGGMGGYVPPVGGCALQMMPNGASPIDVEFTTLASQASVTADLTVDFLEGTS
jgi:hypothetical protein